MIYLYFEKSVQVFLVTGGLDKSDGKPGDGYVNLNYLFSSTEILTEGSSRWIEVGSLPSGMWGLRGVSLDNRIIMTGIITTLLHQITYFSRWIWWIQL